jgi:hypothetical protein
MCMETSHDILLENTTMDRFEDLILVVNIVSINPYPANLENRVSS